MATGVEGEASPRVRYSQLREEEGEDAASASSPLARREGGTAGRTWLPLELEEAGGVYDDDDDDDGDEGIDDHQYHDDHGVWAVHNRAIMLSYFAVGFATNFLVTPMTYYLVHEENVAPDELLVIITLTMLPWSMKILFGFVTDNFPLGGRRRRPYIVLGWGIFCLGNLWLAYLGRPSPQAVALMQFIGSCGFLQADVATDAVCVERSKLEPEATRGTMQAIGYTTRFIGSIVGSALGAVVYNRDRWGWYLTVAQIFAINALIPTICVYSFAWSLQEDRVCGFGASASGISPRERKWALLKKQSSEIFATLSMRAVYIPMTFIFTYNVMQIPNAAWRSFLMEGLSLDAFDLGILSIIGSIFSSMGLVLYKRYFFHTSWRLIYVFTTLVVSLFSLVQLALIFRLNVKWGISDIAFAVGDDALQEMVQGIQFLPVCRMYISLTPDGAEGATYAMLTTLSNISGALAFSAGTHLSNIWDVSNDAFRNGDFSGMWKLTVLTSLLQPLPLVLVGLLPGNKEEQKAMRNSGISDWRCGVVLVALIFGSLSFTIYTAFATLLSPA